MRLLLFIVLLANALVTNGQQIGPQPLQGRMHLENRLPEMQKWWERNLNHPFNELDQLPPSLDSAFGACIIRFHVNRGKLDLQMVWQNEKGFHFWPSADLQRRMLKWLKPGDAGIIPILLTDVWADVDNGEVEDALTAMLRQALFVRLAGPQPLPVLRIVKLGVARPICVYRVEGTITPVCPSSYQ